VYYDLVRTNQDAIMEHLSKGYDGYNQAGVPLITREEVMAILSEGLQDFFMPELSDVVSRHLSIIPCTSNIPSIAALV
jgi:hypothetical protein